MQPLIASDEERATRGVAQQKPHAVLLSSRKLRQLVSAHNGQNTISASIKMREYVLSTSTRLAKPSGNRPRQHLKLLHHLIHMIPIRIIRHVRPIVVQVYRRQRPLNIRSTLGTQKVPSLTTKPIKERTNLQPHNPLDRFTMNIRDVSSCFFGILERAGDGPVSEELGGAEAAETVVGVDEVVDWD